MTALHGQEPAPIAVVKERLRSLFLVLQRHDRQYLASPCILMQVESIVLVQPLSTTDGMTAHLEDANGKVCWRFDLEGLPSVLPIVTHVGVNLLTVAPVLVVSLHRTDDSSSSCHSVWFVGQEVP